jgi:hypothetical protein
VGAIQSMGYLGGKEVKELSFPLFLQKKCPRACVYAKKAVPLSRKYMFRRFGEQKCAKKHIFECLWHENGGMAANSGTFGA